VIAFGSVAQAEDRGGRRGSGKLNSQLFPGLENLGDPILKEFDPPSFTSTPFSLYRYLRPHFERSFILESGAGPKEMAARTFLGFAPQSSLSYENGLLKKYGRPLFDCKRPLSLLEDSLKDLVTRSSSIPHPSSQEEGSYLGGFVGYWSYDLVRRMQPLDSVGRESPFPLMEMDLFLDGIVHLAEEERFFYFTYGEDRLDDLLELASEEKKEEVFALRSLRLNPDRDTFVRSVERAKEYIEEGDIFQVVLSKRMEGRFDGDPFSIYARLRDINPSPYMYHLQFGKRRIIGSSPEMLVKVEDEEISTFPIAGTRPLGENEEERRRFAAELLADEKERAEHNMLVDLARNDVGRVSSFGTVDVPQYMKVKRFSHVQHIVSQVTGELAEGMSPTDAFRSVFPAGTVSGAPKLRAMEIIDELEKVPRGPYAGGVGYLSLDGSLDSCITIRTLFTSDRDIYLQAGAGIVADSVGEREWEETDQKLGALKGALLCEEVGDDE